MNRVLYEIRCIQSIGTRTIAVCSTKAKAISKLKELVADPPCEAPLRESCEYDEDLETAFIENKWGWRATYDIQEIVLDEWID